MTLRHTKVALVSLALLLAACGTSGDGAASSDGPSTDGTETDGPSTDGPSTDEPGTDEPGTDEPGTDEPGGDAVTVDEWAEAFCGGLLDWSTDIQALESDMDFTGVTDPDEVMSILDDFLTSTSSRTQDLIAEIEDAGVPDIDDGDALADDVTALFEDFDSAVQQLQSDVGDLDPASGTFDSDSDALQAEFQAEVDTIGEAFSALGDEYPDEDLDAALTTYCAG